MKKFTKKVLTVSAIVTSLAGALFGTAAGFNSYIEQENSNSLVEYKKDKEQIENKKQSEMDKITYTYLQTYVREKIYNYNSVDFSKFTVPTTLFTENENYVHPIKYSTYSAYKNFQINKHLYVYLDENLNENEKQIVRKAIDYINTIVHTIDPQYLVTVTNQLGNSHAYIHFINDSNIQHFKSENVLGITEIYEDDSPLYNNPIVIRMNNENIEKYSPSNYDRLYKGIAIHEFLHAAGLEHTSHDNEDDLYRPIMCAKSNHNDFLSIPEIAELFGWLNKDKYAEAEQNGTLQEVCNKDFINYLNLIKYSFNQSVLYDKYSPILEENQIVQVQYDETPNDGMDNKTTLTFNYPFANFCEKITLKEDGKIEKSVRPFISAKGKMIILNQDCKHFDEKEFHNSSKEGVSEYKTGLTYDQVMEEINIMDPRNGYEISNSTDIKVNHYEVETQNFWQRLSNTSTKNDIKVTESLYNISYLYTWRIGNVYAEEITNNFDKNLINNNAGYISDNYEKNL